MNQEGVVSIAIMPLYRGSGYGTRALELVKEAAKGAGFYHLIAEVAPDNLPSQKGFLRAGWRPVLFEVWL